MRSPWSRLPSHDLPLPSPILILHQVSQILHYAAPLVSRALSVRDRGKGPCEASVSAVFLWVAMEGLMIIVVI